MFNLALSAGTNAQPLRITSVSAIAGLDGSCPGPSATNTVSWNYTGNPTGSIVEVTVEINGAAAVSLVSGLDVTIGSYTHTLSSLFADAGGTSYDYVYVLNFTKAAVHAVNSPATSATLNRVLETCGV
jgi:hypothetical protein